MDRSEMGQYKIKRGKQNTFIYTCLIWSEEGVKQFVPFNVNCFGLLVHNI